jgi:hypothetical protein
MTDKNKRDDTLYDSGWRIGSDLSEITQELEDVWTKPQADVTQGQKPMISLPSSPNAFTNDDIDETLGLGDIVIPDEMPERLGNAEEEQQAAWQAAREMGGGGASSPKLLGSDSSLGNDAPTTPESVSEISAAGASPEISAAIPEALGVAGSAAGASPEISAAIPEALGVAGSAAGVGLGVAGAGAAAAAAGAVFEAIKTAVTGPAGTRPGSIRDYTPESASGGGGGGIGDAMATQMIMSINKLAGTHSRL